MDFLRLHYDEAMARHAHDPSFLAALTSSRYAAEAWYGTNDRTPAYQAAILLHPSYRLSYVEQQWPITWVKDAKDAVTQLWNREYRDKFTPPSAPTPPLESSQVEGGGTSFRNWKAGLMHVKAVKSKDEFRHFIQGDPLFIEDPLQWWLEPQQQRQYPSLSRMAIDILSANPMSAESERIFSSCRRTISWDRAQISFEHVEMIECLRSWKLHQNLPVLQVVEAREVSSDEEEDEEDGEDEDSESDDEGKFQLELE